MKNSCALHASNRHRQTYTTNTQAATMALLNIRALWLRKLISHNGLEKQDRDVYREKSILMIAWCPALSNLS